MRKQRVFDINNAMADRFKAYCRRNHIDATIERNDTYKRFYCMMDDEELSKAKEFCESRYKPKAKAKAEDPQLVFVYIIIEEISL